VPDDLQIIAEAQLAGLAAGFCAAYADLDITIETAGRIAGFADRYVHKVLAPRPARQMTPEMFDALLATAGCKLFLIVDEEQRAKILRSQAFLKAQVRATSRPY
jgi:NAD(P)-dependent dehydrogenase (short-subunit alcohol dehydrogenase family)